MPDALTTLLHADQQACESLLLALLLLSACCQLTRAPGHFESVPPGDPHLSALFGHSPARRAGMTEISLNHQVTRSAKAPNVTYFTKQMTLTNDSLPPAGSPSQCWHRPCVEHWPAGWYAPEISDNGNNQLTWQRVPCLRRRHLPAHHNHTCVEAEEGVL